MCSHPALYYDAVFMDVQMPVMNGYEATREIRGSGMERIGELPIIAMTADAFAEDVKRARLSGMNGHLAKPVSIELLRGALSGCLDCKRKNRWDEMMDISVRINGRNGVTVIRRQIVRAGWAAMVLLVLTSCGMKDRKQTYPQDEGVTQQQEQAGGQSENMRTSGTEPGLSRKPVAGGGGNAGGCRECQRCRECRNGRGYRGCRKCRTSRGRRTGKAGNCCQGSAKPGSLQSAITGSFFKAGDIRCGLSFELTGEGWESDRLKCVFTLPDEMHTSYYDSMRTAEILTEKGKKAYKITPETMEEVPRVPALTYTIKFAMDDESDPHISVKGEGGLAGDYYLFEDSLTFPDVFSRYLSRADLCLWPTENLWLLRNEIYAANGRQFKSDVLSRYFQKKDGTGESLNRIPFQIPFCRM